MRLGSIPPRGEFHRLQSNVGLGDAVQSPVCNNRHGEAPPGQLQGNCVPMWSPTPLDAPWPCWDRTGPRLGQQCFSRPSYPQVAWSMLPWARACGFHPHPFASSSVLVRQYACARAPRPGHACLWSPCWEQQVQCRKQNSSCALAVVECELHLTDASDLPGARGGIGALWEARNALHLALDSGLPQAPFFPLPSILCGPT